MWTMNSVNGKPHYIALKSWQLQSTVVPWQRVQYSGHKTVWSAWFTQVNIGVLPLYLKSWHLQHNTYAFLSQHTVCKMQVAAWRVKCVVVHLIYHLITPDKNWWIWKVVYYAVAHWIENLIYTTLKAIPIQRSDLIDKIEKQQKGKKQNSRHA